MDNTPDIKDVRTMQGSLEDAAQLLNRYFTWRKAG